MLSASEDWKQSHSAGLRAPSTSIPWGSQQSPKEGCLGPTLVPIPFPPTLQLSARPSPCALHAKEKPEVKDQAFKSVVTSENVERALWYGSSFHNSLLAAFYGWHGEIGV